MTTIVGGLGTSHVPAIANAISNGLQEEPYWSPMFEGYPPVHEWLSRTGADLAVVFYNDHGLNFFLDAMPTFAIGAADEYRSDDEGWGIGTVEPFVGDSDLSWHVIEHVVAAEFDVVTCQDMRVDHGFWVAMELFWPERPADLEVLPININTVQHPLPSAKRCEAFGRAVGEAIRSFPGDHRAVILGTGGLSHQLEGERAGFINREFDELCLDSLASSSTSAITRYTVPELVELAGSQGVEILNWLAMRAALGGEVREIHRNYHIPISNTAAGLLVLEPADAKVTLPG
jgi:protocatechuate 4,5-dioxygenase beta chain